MSRIHVVVFATLVTLTFGWLFSGDHLWAVAGIAAFDWLVAGLLNRTTDLKEDAANHVPGIEFMSQYRSGLRIFALAAMCLSIGAFHFYEPTLTLTRVCFHLLSLFYSQPLLPGRVRLKQLYLVKNVASALCFMLTCFAYPLAKAGWGFFELPLGIEGMTLLFSGIYLFLLIVSFQIVYDLRDRNGDAAAGVESFPVVLGPELAVSLLDPLLGFSAVSLVVGYATHFVPWRVVVLAAAPIALFVIYKPALRRGLLPSDTVLATWVVSAVLALYHVWIFLRLPGIYE